MRVAATAVLLVLLVAAGLYLPVPVAPRPAAESPVAVALAAENLVPLLGLGWGRVRGWQRDKGGWLVLWQPAHGSWMLRVWAPDLGGGMRWRLEVAPWLPGARLSRSAARLLVGGAGEGAVPLERIGRRDWQLGDRRLAGALPTGGALPRRDGGGPWVWLAALGGFLFSGAVVRVVLPVAPRLAWRRRVWWMAAVLAAALPWLTPLGAAAFRVGVRPWVAELALGAAALIVLAAVSVAAARYPAAAGRAPQECLALGLGIGLLAGRLQPVEWLADVAGLSLRAVAWVGIVILGGWLSSLAGEGLRHMVAAARGAGRWVLAALSVAAVLTAGGWLGAVAAVICVAAMRRGQGTSVGAAVLAGWIVTGTSGTCAWPEAQRDVLLLLFLCCGTVMILALRQWRADLEDARP